MQPLIYSLIPKVMSDIGVIGKDRVNVNQKYKFRGIDDVYNAANSALAKHGVFSVPTVLEESRSERTNSNGTLLFYVYMKIKYTFFASDGSSVEAIVSAEAFDSGDKATNKALSAAQKYAFLQVFCIPTEEPKDSEIDSHEIQPVKLPKTDKVEKKAVVSAKALDYAKELRSSLNNNHTEDIWNSVEESFNHKEITQSEYNNLLTIKRMKG